MNLLIDLLFFFSVAIVSIKTQMDKEMIIKEIREKLHSCAAQEKASEDDINIIMDNKMPTSHEGRCVLFCMHKIYGIQDEDGTMDIETTRTTLQAFTEFDANGIMLEQAFEECHSIPVDPDPCDYATSLGDCVVAKAKSRGLVNIILD